MDQDIDDIFMFSNFPKHKSDNTLEDLVKEKVLLHLPAKTICRFRSVCKEWNHWLTSPFLAHLQSYSFREISGFFFQIPHIIPGFISLNHSSYGVPSPTLGFLPEEVTLSATCNGLLCCKSRFAYDSKYYICNPANKEWKMLPKPTLYHGLNSAVALSFEPSVFNFSAHFDLVCAVPFSDTPVIYFEIYSSRSNSWRVSQTECWDPDALVLNGDGFFLDGVAFWETSRCSVLAFHLKDEQYGTLPLPERHESEGALALDVQDEQNETLPLPQRNRLKGALTPMHGELCYIRPCKEEDKLTMEIHGDLKMKLKSKIPLSPEACFEVGGEVRVLACVNDELLMLLAGQNVFAYHLKEGKLEIIGNFFTNAPLDVKFLPYVNSLAPVIGRFEGSDEDFAAEQPQY